MYYECTLVGLYVHIHTHHTHTLMTACMTDSWTCVLCTFLSKPELFHVDGENKRLVSEMR